MSTVFSKKVIAGFFLLLLSSSFLVSFLSAETMFDSLRSSKSGSKKGGRRGQKSFKDYFHDAIDIASAAGFDVIGDIVTEMFDNLMNTSDMLKSYGKEDVRMSANFAIRNLLSATTEAANAVAKKNNNDADTVEPSDFREFTHKIQEILLKRCRNKANFSPLILPHVEAAVPVLLDSLAEIYSNIVSTPVIKSFGLGLSFGMLQKGASMLFLVDRDEYVTADTFKTFADFPAEMMNQLETAFEQVAGQYDRSTIDTVFSVARMAATTLGNRREEREHEHQEV